MAKRLRLRLSRLLPAYFGARRTKDGADADISFPAVVNRSQPAHFDIYHQHHPPVVATGSSCCRPSSSAAASSPTRHSRPCPLSDPSAESSYLWRKEEKYWHVVVAGDGACVDDGPSSPRRKIDSDDGGVVFPPLDTRPRSTDIGRRRKEAPPRTRRRRRSSRFRLSRSNSSLDDDDEDSGWFSSGEEDGCCKLPVVLDESFCCGNEETDALMSTTTDVDSSTDYVAARLRLRRRTSTRSRTAVAVSAESTINSTRAARKLVPCAARADVGVRESFAVVKRSEDPRADFRRSIAEMVVEKEIFDRRGLEQLLHCFLSLNSRRHHATIIAAFRDVCDALFPPASVAGRLP